MMYLQDTRKEVRVMICVPAEIEINEASILAQMDRVKDAQDKLENEIEVNISIEKRKGNNDEKK